MAAAIRLLLLLPLLAGTRLPAASMLFGVREAAGRQGSVAPYSFALPAGEDTLVLGQSGGRGKVSVALTGSAGAITGAPWRHGEVIYRGLTAGAYRLSVSGISDYSGLDLQARGLAAPAVVLFLHGLAGGIDSWDAYALHLGQAYKQRVRVPRIYRGIITRPATLERGYLVSGTASRTQDFYFYRQQFGEYDQSSGLATVDGRRPVSNAHGDFETYNLLGREVGESVAAILAAHPYARILLVGHSRGGLAARAFLQGGSPDAALVAGLLTLGTPHNGSYLGRIAPYLAAHPRYSDDLPTWGVELIIKDKGRLNLLSPSVGFLATGYPAIDQLNSKVTSLPPWITYATYQYLGLSFGEIFAGTGSARTDYGNFVLGTGLAGSYVHLSSEARSFVVGNLDPAQLGGDGIVQADSQVLDPAKVKGVEITVIPGGVFHTEEHDRVADIDQAMRAMLGWTIGP